MTTVTANDNGAPDAGLYTWELSTDTLYADTAVASLFGMDKLETERGLPLAAYLDRVHPEDQPALAEAVSEAIKFGLPFQACYRVSPAEGESLAVVAYGKCFRDRKDEPVLYSGIVFPLPASGTTSDDLHWLCLAALDCAERASRGDIARILKDALIRLADEPLIRLS